METKEKTKYTISINLKPLNKKAEAIFLKIIEGVTTAEEVLRTTFSEEIA